MMYKLLRKVVYVRDVLLGQTLGAYELIERLGGGGMGVVYRGVHKTLRQARAVKVLRTHLVEDETFVQRFILEARTASNLRHPNIVIVHDVGQQDDILYLVMELLDGQSLYDALRSSGPIPVDRSVALLRQLGSALDYAHSRGVVHRDVKSANAIVSGDDRLTLVDFGIARASDGTRLTATGAIIGTPEYMAPEVITGGIANPAADLYALGIIAFEMLTGSLPFRAKQTPQVLYAQAHSRPPSPRSLNPHLSEAIERALLLQLAKIPQDRFGSGMEFVDQLERAALGQAAKASTPDSSILAPDASSTIRSIKQPPPQSLSAGVSQQHEVASSPPVTSQVSPRSQIPSAPASPSGREVTVARPPVSRRAFLVAGIAGVGSLGIYAMTRTGGSEPSAAVLGNPTSGAAKPTAAVAKPADSKPPTAPPAPTAAPAAGASPAASPAAGASPGAKPAAAAAPSFKSTGSKVTVWGWQSFTPEGDKALGDQMKAWGDANKTDVEYVVIENAQFPQKLAAAIEAKAMPDITMLTTPTDVLNFASRDLFVDVADLWKAVAEIEGGFVDYVKDYYNIGSTICAIPFEADTSPLFTRLDLVEKATGKREPPRTLDELTEVAKKINQPPGVYGLGICLGRTPDGEGEAVQMIWNEGGSLVDKDGKPNLNTQSTIDAMKRMKGWWDDKLIPPGSTTWDDTGNNSAYQAKQVAFVRNPPSIYAWLQINDQELLRNSTMAAFPAGKGGSYSLSGAWSWSVFKASKNVDGAKDLIYNLMDPEKLQSVYEAVGGRWYPIYKNGPKHEYWLSREIYKFFPDLLAGGRGLWYPSSPEPKLAAALGEVRTRSVIPDLVQDIVVKGAVVETAVKTAHDAMAEIFKARGANV